jgi:hypothetical protein
MVTAAELNVVGGIGGRVSAIRGGWSTAERERRAAKATRRTQHLAALLGLLRSDEAVASEPVILAVGAPSCEDLRRMAN